MDKYDVAIVGGGIAGLTAALYAVKAGKKTIVIEKQGYIGGRAMTTKKRGAYFNLGGHALYFGDAYETFQELGLRLQGKKPSIDGYGIWKGKLNTMPMGVKSLFSTPLLSWKGKMELAVLLAKLGKLDTHQWDQMSVREWVEGNLHDSMVRNLFYALLRPAGYVVATDVQAAGPVLNQLKNSLKGVMYLDRGWGSLVDELWKKASDDGVHFLTRSKAITIGLQNGTVQNITCKDGTKIEARNIILAIPPAVAYELVPHAETTSLNTWKEQAIEITAACLDVVLRHLPKPKQQFVYGIDQPIFLSNQSRAAYLSDNGDQVISLIKYQGNETDPDKDLLELQQTLDLVQPGWRNELVTQQHLSKITVCHDFMHTKRKVNPGPNVPEFKGLYVAGEWATHGELLVDGATASAKRAIEHILSQEKMERKSKNEHRNIV